MTAAEHTFSDLRQGLGFGLLAAAFSIAVAAGLRARRPASSYCEPPGFHSGSSEPALAPRASMKSRSESRFK